MAYAQQCCAVCSARGDRGLGKDLGMAAWFLHLLLGHGSWHVCGR